MSTKEKQAVCVCGHAESEHDPNGGFTVFFHGCESCDLFRPCLDWPNSEGNWWCSVVPYACRISLRDGEIVIGTHESDDWCPRKDFYELMGVMQKGKPILFTRLLEPNPFEPKP